ncbi:DUF3732 domain-containing protein [Spirosoma panaciterrae]|uniref:DUF3732 domain-containing protein n=1 Tax=Spirosoma panaciterrae TaxID=496058 RepID=UPI000378C3B3|nr:DUF3732 domain-containing protein [Spirosoma panaciterrae]
MQIKSILLYNLKGNIRSLDFKIGAVNIITGESRTGKSAIIDILDYCLGRSTFNVFEGVNRDVISWYGVVLQLGDNQILIAKPAPEGLATTQSQAYWEEAHSITIPPLNQLVPNTNDEGVNQNLSRLLGISPNQTVVAEGRTMSSFQATLDHTKYYLFQDQGLVANKKLLFWRQAEGYIAQHIKDTIPYFLGAVQEKRLQLIQQLRDSRRQLKLIQQEIKESEAIVKNQNEGARKLLEESKAIGIYEGEINNNLSNDSLIEALRRVSEWTPNQTIGIVGSPIETERQKAKDIRRSFRLKQDEIQETLNYLKQADGFANEANEQAARLSAVKIFGNGKVNYELCPLCESKLETPTPSVQAVLGAFNRIRASVDNIQRERPRVENYLEKLYNELQVIRQEARVAEQRVNALVQEEEAAIRLGEINVQAARVSGRVSLYLENLKTIEPNSNLQEQANKLIPFIKDLEEQLDIEQVDEIMASILNVIGAQMTLRATKLQLEHANESRYRLDTKKLTVIADSPDRPIGMERMGSAENWLGCHLITLLSLHEYFIKKNRPVPNFLVLDQPSQVYFPSEVAYKSLDGKSQDLQQAGADVLAVQRMFNLLFEVTQELHPNLQVIVIEHANLKDDRFQKALVEEPWTDGRALIPLDWLNK